MIQSLANHHSYFSKYALSTVYLPDPIHSKYINQAVVSRYLPVGGVRIEDDILITKDGYENLTTAPKGQAMLDEIAGVAPDRQRKFPDPFPVGSNTMASLWADSPLNIGQNA
jgi:hypothetical protein